MAQWFRFYNTALDDPKVQSLPPDIFKFWINILCLACRNDGKIPSIADCAFALRTEETVVLTVLERLSNATLIDRCNGGVNGWHITPHNWHKWQYKSDTSTERVKRFRNVAETANETHQRQKQNTETEKKEEPSVLPKKKEVSKKGLRLDPNWEPTDADTQIGFDAKLTADDIQREYETFMDYWQAKPGAAGTKLDWNATFRNWLRKAADDKATRIERLHGIGNGSTSFRRNG